MNRDKEEHSSQEEEHMCKLSNEVKPGTDNEWLVQFCSKCGMSERQPEMGNDHGRWASRSRGGSGSLLSVKMDLKKRG